MTYLEISPAGPTPQITFFFLRTVKNILITATSENSSFLAKSLAPGDGQQAAATSGMPIQQGAVLSASEVPVNQGFQPEACHATARPSVVMTAESGCRRGGGMLSACGRWFLVLMIQY